MCKRRIFSSSTLLFKCLLLILAASLASWLTAYSFFGLSARGQWEGVCFGAGCWSWSSGAVLTPNPAAAAAGAEVFPEEEEGDNRDVDDDVNLEDGERAGESQDEASASEFTEYGVEFTKDLEDELLKYGKKRRPAYNFPAQSVGELKDRDLQDLLCEMKKYPPFLLTDQSPPFDVNPLGKYLHQDGPMLGGKTFKTCACVSSSGLLKGRNLGEFIDSHEAVLRMNKAPVVGYEKDVGRKTTIRIINNSMLRVIDRDKMPLGRRPWDFPDSKNATLLAWEACADKGPITKCLENYETVNIKKLNGESMQPFFRWRKRNMDRELYFLNPDWLWQLWDLLQRYSSTSIVGHIPTTGFIGFAFLMHFCERVTVFELIPSKDYQDKKPCYYFDTKESDFCFTNGYHPKIAEMSMLLGMNVGDMVEVFRDGYATVPGLANLQCGS